MKITKLNIKPKVRLDAPGADVTDNASWRVQDANGIRAKLSELYEAVKKADAAQPGADGALVGAKGDRGPKGETGDRGPTGPKGETGPQGLQGPPGILRQIPGAKGVNGLPGPKGDDGRLVTGAQGPRGDDGKDWRQLVFPDSSYHSNPGDEMTGISKLTEGIQTFAFMSKNHMNSGDIIYIITAFCPFFLKDRRVERGNEPMTVLAISEIRLDQYIFVRNGHLPSLQIINRSVNDFGTNWKSIINLDRVRTPIFFGSEEYGSNREQYQP